MNEVVRAAALLRAGELVAFPTETVYGLGADASNPGAIARIFAAKGRPADHPLIVHLPDAGQLERWAVDIPEAAHGLAAAFWPGPLTLILRRHPSVSDAITGGQDTVGLRVPNHPLALQLLREFGGGVAAPSANRFGRISPTTAAHVRDELGAAVSMILDGGPCAVGIESTILDLSAGRARILRPGMLDAAAIAAVLGYPPAWARSGVRRGFRVPSKPTMRRPPSCNWSRQGISHRRCGSVWPPAGASPCWPIRNSSRRTRGSPAIRPAPTRSASPMISMPHCVSWMRSAAT
jgi:tRNA threonylcarbamoyl adenosine modification protein (Sua5/YciO/YrdC/YwlC family)